MPPKKAPTVEEIEDIKKSLDFLGEEISAVRVQQKTILDLVEEVKALRLQNSEKAKRIAILENRVEELEQYTRMNDIIVTGLQIQPRSYAGAVARRDGEELNEEDANSVEKQVLAFLHSKGIEVKSNNIEACHPLPRRSNTGKPAVIMRFANRKHKMQLLKQGKKLKGSDVFLNEHLTKKNADIAKKARLLRKQGKIQNTWTQNCKIFIKLKGSPEEAKILVIRDIGELDKF
ncbi:uncharacterized protein LOC132873941 [Neoarius graeffei]|uniref:uncharacterized protein LOC132873941 n=1 Tax=Neoarius graeffei TaxID=443677 RepID=UPI00298CFB54|nr:uncharacterized protein LOC132873941 [Neoarius graeffei]XP_060765757.1 uncharacterized protein LOC132873941 [Neoarius graeffei]